MKYDVIVIGAGSAGLNVAVFMNRIKLKVLMIEKGLVGGDCLNYGCVPSKALIHLAHAAKDIGLKVEGSVDLATVAKTIDDRQEVFRKHESPEYFRKQGIDVEEGAARFSGKNSVSVNGKEYFAKRIIIATGSRPFVPPIPGLDKISYFTNETIFANKELPPRLLVIGDGPIGIELAQSYQRLGSSVTLLSRCDRILSKEDKDVSEIICKQLVSEGMDIRFNVNAVRFEDSNTLVVSGYDAGSKKNVGPEEKISFDQVLIATGRTLNIDSLDLDKAGIELRDKKLVLDKYLRTTNKNVYAAGDAAGRYLFTHWAEYEAGIAINNMLSPIKKTPDPSKIAWVTYTDPEIASFGISWKELASRKIKYETVEMEFSDVDRAICEGVNYGKAKVYLVKGKIAGGTMIGPNAGELSAELISAMTQRIPFAKLFNRIYPYPTMSRVTRKLVGKHLGGKLTERSMAFLRTLFKMQ